MGLDDLWLCCDPKRKCPRASECVHTLEASEHSNSRVLMGSWQNIAPGDPGDSAMHGLSQQPYHCWSWQHPNVWFLEISEFWISSLTYPTVGNTTCTMAISAEHSVPHQPEVGECQQEMKETAQWVIWWSQTLIVSVGINQESSGHSGNSNARGKNTSLPLVRNCNTRYMCWKNSENSENIHSGSMKLCNEILSALGCCRVILIFCWIYIAYNIHWVIFMFICRQLKRLGGS